MEEPLYRRIRRHAESRLSFDLNSSPDQVLQDCREYLRLEDQMTYRYHRNGDNGTRVAQARSCVIDVLIENLFGHAIAAYKKRFGPLPCPASVVALGGYGRAELSPFSDIDVMFLLPDQVSKRNFRRMQETFSENLLLILWDLKLRVGPSTRTVSHTFEDAKKDIETKTAMLEARFITGQKTLFAGFIQRYKRFYRRDHPEAYIQARLDDQSSRRRKHQNTVFLQEPDIKSGVGGLREYQNILWMAEIKLGMDSMAKLHHRNYLSRSEFRAYTQGYEFLLRVRNELHFQSSRPTDLLNLEKQPNIARKLGYRQKNISKRVEAFMRDYYTHAKEIYRVTQILERRLFPERYATSNRNRVSNTREAQRRKVVDGFILRRNTLTHLNSSIFEEEPERLIRVFRHCQQLDAVPDFALGCMITESLPLLTKSVVHSPTANRSFRGILQTVGDVYPTLSKMHELGVLGRFLPEFSALTCLVQHEYYHRYTADEHTLNTIQELDRIFSGESQYSTVYGREIHNTKSPSLLYLVLLLHDIGKGKMISGHAEIGAEMARTILARMQISRDQIERIIFLIKNHLEMWRFWQRYDVEDPETGEVFAEFVKDEETLRLLFVHTYCDSRGTHSDLWNSYKDGLHRRLFHTTLEHLHGKISKGVDERRKAIISRTRIKKAVPHVSGDEITAHFHQLPESYFADNGVDQISYHLDIIHRLLRRVNEMESFDTLVPIVDWRDDLNLSMTVVNIATWDRPGLFYKLAGAFSVAGLNILSSRAMSRMDSITIDSFYVCEPGGGFVQDQKARDRFQASLESALKHNEDLLPVIVAQAKKDERPSFLRFDERLDAPIPHKVDIHRDQRLNRIIVEVQATDQIGLLYRIAKAIYDRGFNIDFARISTELDVAVDTFHITDIDTVKEDNSEDLQKLEASLISLVS